MAIRLKTKWHRSKRSDRNQKGSRKPKTLVDLSSVIAFNIWKLGKESFSNMEKEGYRFREDEQAIDVISEFLFFQMHIVDRMMYGKVDEKERTAFINGLGGHLLAIIVDNSETLLGEGDYRTTLLDKMNARLAGYSECKFDKEEGPSYDLTRLLASYIREIMTLTDDKWVVEQVIEIEAPGLAEKVKQVSQDVLGLRNKPDAKN